MQGAVVKGAPTSMAQSFMKNLCKKQRSSQAVTTEILYLVVNTIYLYM